MKIRNKLTFFTLLVVAVPFVLGMVVVRNVAKNGIQSISLAPLEDTAKSISDSFSSFFIKKLQYTQSLASMQAAKQMDWPQVKKVIDEINLHSYEEFILTQLDGTYWKSTVPGNPAYNYLVSKDDKDPNAQLNKLTARDYYRYLIVENTSGEHRRIVTDPVFSMASGQSQIICGSAIIDDNNKVCGLIAATVVLSEIEKMYQASITNFEEHFGKEAIVVVISSSDDIIMNYQYDEVAETYINKGNSVPLTNDFNNARLEYNTTSKAPIAFLNNGEEYYMSGLQIPSSDYTVFVAVPEKAIFNIITVITSSMIAIIICTLLLVSVCIFFMARGITKPLSNLALMLKKLAAGGGDLTFHLDVIGNDEIAEVSTHVNQFLETQHGMISSIKNQSEKIAEVSKDLSTNTEIMEQNIQSIESNMDDLNHQTVEQGASVSATSAMLKNITQNIDDLSQMVETQSSAVSESSAAIQQMVANIESISTNLDRADKSFGELKTSSDSGRSSIENVQDLVSEVSVQSAHLLETNEVINAIASQTNLLAMNAAIEAAHAGDAGKGFSVVADEIRKLAEDSAAQSKAIETDLKNIVQKISQIVDASATAETAFGSVAKKINEATGLTAEIAMSMKEQNEGSHKILDSLANMQAATTQIKENSKMMTNGTAAISSEMEHLSDISAKVQQKSHDIGAATKSINSAVDDIVLVSQNNLKASDALKEMTSRFKL